MMLLFTWRTLFRYFPMLVKIIAVILVVGFVTTKLFLFFWDLFNPFPKIHQQDLLEVPLRVMSKQIINEGSI